MRKRTLAITAGTAMLLMGATSEALAARTRRASDRFGGSARRGRSGGEALAQSFYERAVLLGKQGQFGQAANLMTRVVTKNPSNDKYRYYKAILLYKNGDLSDAARECRTLNRSGMERYRRKAQALQARIDKILRGEVDLVRPLREPGGAPGSGWGGGYASRYPPRGFGGPGMPEDAYMNVADMAGRFYDGRYSPPSVRQGPTMSSEAYRNWSGGSAYSSPRADTGSDRNVAAAAQSASRLPPGYVDPAAVASKPSRPAPAAPTATKPAPAPKPKAPPPPAAEPPPAMAEDPFADPMDAPGDSMAMADKPSTPAASDSAFSDAVEEDPWGEAGSDAGPASPPAPPPPAPPPPAPPPSDDGFGDIVDEADGGSDAGSPAAGSSDGGFGDGGGFGGEDAGFGDGGFEDFDESDGF